MCACALRIPAITHLSIISKLVRNSDAHRINGSALLGGEQWHRLPKECAEAAAGGRVYVEPVLKFDAAQVGRVPCNDQ